VVLQVVETATQAVMVLQEVDPVAERAETLEEELVRVMLIRVVVVLVEPLVGVVVEVMDQQVLQVLTEFQVTEVPGVVRIIMEVQEQPVPVEVVVVLMDLQTSPLFTLVPREEQVEVVPVGAAEELVGEQVEMVVLEVMAGPEAEYYSLQQKQLPSAGPVT
jgi:hypothetical protein